MARLGRCGGSESGHKAQGGCRPRYLSNQSQSRHGALPVSGAAASRGAQIGIMVGGVVLAALLGWLLSGLLIRPISAVVGAAGRIGKDDLEARVPNFPDVTPREYRELGMAFNSMAG